MNHENKRLTDRASQIWKEIMLKINKLDTELNPDDLTEIHSKFTVDDEDFYVECNSERMLKGVCIFDDGSIYLSVIGREGFNSLDWHDFYDSDEVINTTEIVKQFLER